MEAAAALTAKSRSGSVSDLQGKRYNETIRFRIRACRSEVYRVLMRYMKNDMFTCRRYVVQKVEVNRMACCIWKGPIRIATAFPGLVCASLPEINTEEDSKRSETFTEPKKGRAFFAE
nr:hypothetical protein Iba_chr05fCG13870 [Ipomoea batatas]